MTPNQIAKSGSESAHQKAFFAYCAVAAHGGFERADLWAAEDNRLQICKFKPIPELEWIFHIPNGGTRGDEKVGRSIRGGQLKAEGVREGVWDIMWPCKIGSFPGLWIEMKKPTIKPKRETSKGGVSDKQAKFGNFVYNQGYKVAVCYSWQEAVQVLKNYYNQC